MQSCYVKATDGVKLAIDVMLPKEKPSNAPLPCVLFQARCVEAQRQDMLAVCACKALPLSVVALETSAHFTQVYLHT